MSTSFALDLGGETVVTHGSRLPIPSFLDDTYAAFVRPVLHTAHGDYELLFEEDETALNGWRKAPRLFDAVMWSLRRARDRYYALGLAFKPPRPFWIGSCDLEMARFRVVTPRTDPPIPRSIAVEFPVRILSRLAFMHRHFERSDGMIVHTAAAAFADRMFLLLGQSRAGKSTISRQILAHGEGELVNDDRMILTSEPAPGSPWTAWGTPWPGELSVARNRNAPLAALLFLKKSDRSFVEPLPPQAALKKLLRLVSIPWYDDELVPKALDLCDRLVREAPPYVLHFCPDPSAAAAVADLARQL
jgi:hypothetical protein